MKNEASISWMFEAKDFQVALKNRSKNGITYRLSEADCKDLADIANNTIRVKTAYRVQYAEKLERALAIMMKGLGEIRPQLDTKSSGLVAEILLNAEGAIANDMR